MQADWIAMSSATEAYPPLAIRLTRSAMSFSDIRRVSISVRDVKETASRGNSDVCQNGWKRKHQERNGRNVFATASVACPLRPLRPLRFPLALRAIALA